MPFPQKAARDTPPHIIYFDRFTAGLDLKIKYALFTAVMRSKDILDCVIGRFG
jgi:hypothetical protein